MPVMAPHGYTGREMFEGSCPEVMHTLCGAIPAIPMDLSPY
jgi:hypothetical protein